MNQSTWVVTLLDDRASREGLGGCLSLFLVHVLEPQVFSELRADLVVGVRTGTGEIYDQAARPVRVRNREEHARFVRTPAAWCSGALLETLEGLLGRISHGLTPPTGEYDYAGEASSLRTQQSSRS
jgi:hypothetical protein